MIEGIDFSEQGERPTPMELRLLQQTTSMSPFVEIGRRLVRELGDGPGLYALCVILDEIGGEKVHVPRRRHLFQALWRVERDALICNMLATPGGWTVTEVAEAMGVSQPYVSRIAGGGNRSGRQ